MSLTLNEIKKRALEFSKEWMDETREDAEAKSFWDGFFNVFGISRRRVASFEEPVKKLNQRYGYIDLFWKSTLIVEHKSRGEDLDKAREQAFDYFEGISETDLPKFVLISDFNRFILHDLEEKEIHEFELKDLHKNLHRFGFITGFTKKTYKEEDPVNIEAAEMMGKLHDALLASGYSGHPLEQLLVRLLFCLFAEDTGIFPRGHFEYYIQTKTNIDGSDIGSQLTFLFQVLNTPDEQRQTTLDEDLRLFPYVNGSLFRESLPVPAFDSGMRDILLNCCAFDWSRISPAIFGSMFQSVMDPAKRRNLGAHYTSEKNILKVIRGLFLDDIREEFHAIQNNVKKLEEFYGKISGLKFLDPACGCGNFLIITYREMRLLEIDTLKRIRKLKGKEDEMVLGTHMLSLIDVDQMYGIEYEEFPVRIAEVALWLMDHQMNIRFSEEFGEYFVRLPLKKSPHIVHGNALKTDWNSIVSKKDLAYILGNPPFSGSKIMADEQRSEIKQLFADVNGAGVLDYVTGWYIKAAQYIQNTKIKTAFVSTNSITQGEQVGILWTELINKYHIKIHFAHRTFKWSNEARGMAAVYCVIIGFANYDTADKHLYDYETITSEPHVRKASNINPYLVDYEDILINKRSDPICKVPSMNFGNMPLDGGHLILSDEEKIDLIKTEPSAKQFIKPLISAKEFLNNEKRWCLWLVDVEPNELKEMPEIMKRVKAVKEFREKSIAPSTRKFAITPYLFRDKNQPKHYILVPSTTSENRKYIPIGFFGKDDIANNSCHIVPNGTLYHFGVLMSEMHMAWVMQVCGRLESRFRYSKDIVYNNYPWPENASDKNIKKVETAAQSVLDARKEFKDSSLADLYDPIAMPKALTDAHKVLDSAVDQCYRPQPFRHDMERLTFLFDLYKKYSIPLLEGGKRGKKK